jgi:hypothetical protein
VARGALRDPEFVCYQRHVLEYFVARLGEEQHHAEALLLAPFAALLRRAHIRGEAGALPAQSSARTAKRSK